MQILRHVPFTTFIGKTYITNFLHSMQGSGRAAGRLIRLMCQSNRSQRRSNSTIKKEEPTSTTSGTSEQLIINNNMSSSRSITDSTNPIQSESQSQRHQNKDPNHQEEKLQSTEETQTAKHIEVYPSRNPPPSENDSKETESDQVPEPKNRMETTNASESRALVSVSPMQSVACVYPQNLVDANNNSVSHVPSTTENLTSGPSLKVVVSPVRGPITVLGDTKNATIIYTDASIVRGKAGIGAFFGDGHPLNLSKELPGSTRGSTGAEIVAAKMALQTLRGWSKYNNSPVILRTDCYQIIDAMQHEPHGPFAEQFQELKNLALSFPKGVQFEHVYGHTGDYGNEAADKLAYEAVSQRRHRSRSRSRQPSPKMLRRTRTSYVSKEKEKRSHKQRKPLVLPDSSTTSDEPLPALPPIPVVTKRDTKHEKILKTESSAQSLEVDNTQESDVASKKETVRKSHIRTSNPRLLKKIQVNIRTPPTSRKTSINGRPITWAPKKKPANPKFSKDYSDQEQAKLSKAEKFYSMEQKQTQIVTAVENLSKRDTKSDTLMKNKHDGKEQLSSSSIEGDDCKENIAKGRRTNTRRQSRKSGGGRSKKRSGRSKKSRKSGGSYRKNRSSRRR